MRALTIASTAIVTVVGVATAQAGGFAVREQSAYGQGSSFAGMAAPGIRSAPCSGTLRR